MLEPFQVTFLSLVTIFLDVNILNGMIEKGERKTWLWACFNSSTNVNQE